MRHNWQKIYHNLYFKLVVFVTWLIVVWWLMETPMTDLGLPGIAIPNIDKLVHLVLFGLLTIFIWRILKIFLHNRWARLTWSASGALAYAYLTENFQQYIGSRSMSYVDLIASASGVLLALMVIYKLRESKPTLLVHLCCGPCAAGAMRELKRKYFVVLLFANSNLDSHEEYQRRYRAAKRLADYYGLKLVKSHYSHDQWLRLIQGHEDAPERGSRCQICYRYRMSETAVTAKFYGYDYFSTSLTTSPHKDGQAVMSIGRELQRTLGVKFLDYNFGAADGYRLSVTESKKLGLYRQKYCGCEFSLSAKGRGGPNTASQEAA